ncbi:etoposide-induced protein 2.4 homolog [Halichondria panicea]|uniref:etoposide-induced protein 2.4 homolog n=1 Tax=Halichondria panicea TaxID=6063 RepID=UPI00312B330C
MVGLKDVTGALQCILLGAKDSVLGIWPVFQLIKKNDKVRSQMLQCFLLNGVILWLSVLLFDYVLLPVIQIMANFVFSFVRGSSDSEDVSLLGLVTWYMFTGLWVLPVFWISKPINSIWFQDIASAAFKGSNQRSKTKKSESSSSLSQSISRLIADLLFSIVIELLFLIQAMLVGLIPIVGYYASVLHMAVLYSLYSFEYKWMYQGWIVHQRIALIEKNWPYFVGFGLPLAVLTALPSSTVISACIFAVAFPFYIVSANEAKPRQSTLSTLPLFTIVVVISNKLFSKSDPASFNSKVTLN